MLLSHSVPKYKTILEDLFVLKYKIIYKFLDVCITHFPNQSLYNTSYL